MENWDAIGGMQGRWSRRQVEKFLDLDLVFLLLFPLSCMALGICILLSVLPWTLERKLSGPHRDEGKDSRKLAAESWLWWKKTLRECVEVALCSFFQRGRK